jgi:F0F1-type ATP synthase beta subunit
MVMDRKRKRILYVDNIFRFTQAGSGICVVGSYAISGGYQPTLATEMGLMQEELLQQRMVLLHQFRRFTYLLMT